MRPFGVEVGKGRYWLTRLKSRKVTPAMQVFSAWLAQAASCQQGG